MTGAARMRICRGAGYCEQASREEQARVGSCLCAELLLPMEAKLGREGAARLVIFTGKQVQVCGAQGRAKPGGIRLSAKRDGHKHPRSPVPLQTFAMCLPTPAQRVRVQPRGTRPQHAFATPKTPFWSRALFSPGRCPGPWVGGSGQRSPAAALPATALQK